MEIPQAAGIPPSPGKPLAQPHAIHRIGDIGEGGFILSTGAVVDHAKPENLHTLIEGGREYGVYR